MIHSRLNVAGKLGQHNPIGHEQKGPANLRWFSGLSQPRRVARQRSLLSHTERTCINETSEDLGQVVAKSRTQDPGRSLLRGQRVAGEGVERTGRREGGRHPSKVQCLNMRMTEERRRGNMGRKGLSLDHGGCCTDLLDPRAPDRNANPQLGPKHCLPKLCVEIRGNQLAGGETICRRPRYHTGTPPVELRPRCGSPWPSDGLIEENSSALVHTVSSLRVCA